MDWQPTKMHLLYPVAIIVWIPKTLWYEPVQTCYKHYPIWKLKHTLHHSLSSSASRSTSSLIICFHVWKFEKNRFIFRFAIFRITSVRLVSRKSIWQPIFNLSSYINFLSLLSLPIIRFRSDRSLICLVITKSLYIIGLNVHSIAFIHIRGLSPLHNFISSSAFILKMCTFSMYFIIILSHRPYQSSFILRQSHFHPYDSVTWTNITTYLRLHSSIIMDMTDSPYFSSMTLSIYLGYQMEEVFAFSVHCPKTQMTN